MPPHIPSKGHDGQRATTTNQPLSNLLFRGRLLLWSVVWEATVVSSAWHEKPKTTTSGNEATRHTMAEISRTGTVLELKHFTISWCVDLFIVQHMPQVELILSCEHLWACLLREKAINISGCSVMPQCVHRVYIVPQETQYVLKSDASMQTKQRAHLIWAPPTKSRKSMKKSAKNEAKRKTFKSKHNQEKTPPKKTRMRE